MVSRPQRPIPYPLSLSLTCGSLCSVADAGGLLFPPSPFHRMLNQTLNYLDHFARFTQKENVEAVERLLSAHKDLAKFERAQLGMDKSFVAT